MWHFLCSQSQQRLLLQTALTNCYLQWRHNKCCLWGRKYIFKYFLHEIRAPNCRLNKETTSSLAAARTNRWAVRSNLMQSHTERSLIIRRSVRPAGVRVYKHVHWRQHNILFVWGTRWLSWLRHWATSRKVAGSIPDWVTGIFQWLNLPVALWP
jgi:hypothetical protein